MKCRYGGNCGKNCRFRIDYPEDENCALVSVEKNDEGLTLVETGERVGLSYNRVRQIEIKAIQKLREIMKGTKRAEHSRLFHNEVELEVRPDIFSNGRKNRVWFRVRGGEWMRSPYRSLEPARQEILEHGEEILISWVENF